ncbi:ER lumen protein-retaining receptor erd-2.2 isoform X3 [Diabrotica virgifera virgifera]|uniref:ER lumen protein-retaining receptor C28H8.4 n=1 Tax=Diabrotica virgifera virgifera TaxID=50390 RepID=A0ABM5JR24_DIAVI|nr:ER lumen protein-retaining receptor erd-2.2 isoform X3 [Diabrotica virgifera virgifera]
MNFVISIPLAIAIWYLVTAILKHKSYVGISAKTQLLYTVAVVANCNISIDYILLIVLPSIVAFALAFKMRDTYEKEADGFWTEILLTPALILSTFVYEYFSSFDILSAFGEYLESVAFIPQLYMIWNSERTTKHMKIYTYLLFFYKMLNMCIVFFFHVFHGRCSIRYSAVVILNFIILSVAVLTVRSKRIVLDCQEEKMDTKSQNIFVVTSGLAPPITLTKPDAVPDAANEVSKPSLL